MRPGTAGWVTDAMSQDTSGFVKQSKLPFLEWTGEGGECHACRLSQPEVWLGSDPGADVNPGWGTLKRRHAVLRLREREYIIEDAALAGILLNGGPVYSAVLREGDLLELGGVQFLYHEG